VSPTIRRSELSRSYKQSRRYVRLASRKAKIERSSSQVPALRSQKLLLA
jgi:hypothetical protein